MAASVNASAGSKRSRLRHHYAVIRDTAQHTLEQCSAWDAERDALIAMMEEDLFLSALVKVMLKEERSWNTIFSFCEGVIL